MMPAEAIAYFHETVAAGDHWYVALLKTMSRWTVAEEVIGDRRYRYLIGGEAFDWLLLAERLLDTAGIECDPDERDALLFNGHPPLEIEDDEFQMLIGTPKYQAYLNFLYGVVVEEALQYAVEEELVKEQHAHVWSAGYVEGAGMFLRIYGLSLAELRGEFQQERGLVLTEELDYTELKEFTYWLFKYRVRNGEGARVASDTRKGLVALSRLEAAYRKRTDPANQAQEVTTVEADLSERVRESDRERRARRRQAFAARGFD